MPDTNNSISLSGRVTDGPEYSHTIYGEAFFKLVLTVQRLSGTEDKIPVTVSERLLGGIPVEHGMYFHIQGQIRSYNQQTEKGSRLIITVFAREFIPASADETDVFAYKNEVELFGYICKPVIYRTTPFLREICGRSACSQQTVRQIRLSALYRMGTKRKVFAGYEGRHRNARYRKAAKPRI